MSRPRFRLRTLMLAVAAVAVGLGGLAWLGRLGLLGIVWRVALVPLVPLAAGCVVFGFDRLLATLDRQGVTVVASEARHAPELAPAVVVVPGPAVVLAVPRFSRRSGAVLPGVLASGLPSR